MKPPPSLVHLPVCVGETVGGTGKSPTHLVHCKRKEALVPFSSCAECGHLRSVFKETPASTLFVECDDGSAAMPVEFDALRAARSEPIASILRHRFVVSRGDATWGELEEALLDDEFRAVTVVNELGHPEGTVSTGALLAPATPPVDELDPSVPLGFPAHVDATPRLTARELMSSTWESLPANAPIALATAVFAASELHDLPVVDEHGKVQGVLAARDVLRWFAQKMGYQVASDAP